MIRVGSKYIKDGVIVIVVGENSNVYLYTTSSRSPSDPPIPLTKSTFESALKEEGWKCISSPDDDEEII
jgi:hypothetical protein